MSGFQCSKKSFLSLVLRRGAHLLHCQLGPARHRTALFGTNRHCWAPLETLAVRCRWVPFGVPEEVWAAFENFRAVKFLARVWSVRFPRGSGQNSGRGPVAPGGVNPLAR